MRSMMFRPVIVSAIAAFAFAASAPVMGGEKEPRAQSLSGQLLVASSKIGDPRFAGTVIYMVDHDASGAFGLVINRAIGSGPLNTLLKGFGIGGDEIAGTIRLHYGGPVEPSRGFVLHSSDYKSDATTEVDNEVSITTELDILKAIGKGNGPRHSLFALGYAGWSAGQLERELMRQDWLTAPADSKLIFDADLDSKWDRASAHAGLPL